MRLQPLNHSDQPIFANITAVQGVSGTVFLDFGFVEPQAFGALARMGLSGKKAPESVGGRLV